MVTLKCDYRAGSKANGVLNCFVTQSTAVHVGMQLHYAVVCVCDHEVEMEWDAEGTRV